MKHARTYIAMYAHIYAYYAYVLTLSYLSYHAKGRDPIPTYI